MSDSIAAAWAALQAGQPEVARRLLLPMIQNDPANGQAWYLLAHVLDDPAQKNDCLVRARAHGYTAVSLPATSPGAKPTTRVGSAQRRPSFTPILLSIALVVALLAIGGYVILAVNPRPAAQVARSSAASTPMRSLGLTATVPATQAPPAVSTQAGPAAGLDPFPDDTDNDGSDNDVDPNDDSDAIADLVDNCPLRANPTQADVDSDGKGDACDDDADGDKLTNQVETFIGSDPLDASSRPELVGFEASCTDGQDNDRDGTVDGVDQGCIDTDNDTNPDMLDNCPTVADRSWNDRDQDGIGDACDPTPLPPNSAPSVVIAPAFSVDEGATIIITATVSDPEEDAEDLEVVRDISSDYVYIGHGPITTYDTAYFAYDGPSVHVMTIEVRDTWGLTATTTTSVTVRNVPPLVAPIAAPLTPISSGDLATLSATFTDPGALDHHTARWDWGDGQSTAATPEESWDSSSGAGRGSASASHAYAAPGTYRVTLTVTDDDGGSSTVTTAVVVR